MPEDWEPKTLGELASIRGETVNPRNAIGLKYVGLEHIRSGEVQIDRWGDPTKVKSTKNHFYRNDILYGKLRPYLDKAVLAEEEGIASTDILVITSNKADPSFLVYLLHSNRFLSYAKATTSGVNHPRTSWSALSKFQFEVPPLKEQSVIARLLSVIQAAKAARQLEIRLERERKAAIMQHLFACGIRNELTLETEIGTTPANWNVESIGSLLKEKIKNGLYKLNALVDDGNAQLIQLSDLFRSDRILNLTDLRAVKLNQEEIDAYLVENNDFMINRVSKRKEGIGKVAVVKISDNAKRIVFESNMFRVRLNDKKIDVDYFSFFTEDLRYKRQAQRKSQKGNQTSINQSALKSILIPVPPFNQQREIVKLLSSHYNVITALQKEKELLEELFKLLLEELMAGHLSTKSLIEVVGL